MAYRLQAEAFGNLDRETKRLLDRLADQPPVDDLGGDGEPTASAKPGAASRSSPVGYAAPLVLKPGALLTREWQRHIERVMVLEEGFTPECQSARKFGSDALLMARGFSLRQ